MFGLRIGFPDLRRSGLVGGALLLAGEPAGLGIDFTAPSGLGSVAVKGHTTNLNNVPVDDFLTNSGTSTKWVKNAAGVYVEKAAGTVAIEYDGGYYALVEPLATNLILNNAVMETQNVTVTAVPHTLSFFGTGTVTLSGVSTAGPLVGTGENDRVSLAFTPTAGTLTLTVSGSVTKGQLETGSAATSPIPTAGATVTRAADVINVAISAFPFSATAGAVIADITMNAVLSAQGITGFSDTTVNEQLLLYNSNASGNVILDTTDGGVGQTSISGVSVLVPGTRAKLGLAFALNDFALVMNGGAAAVDASATLPTVTQLHIGNIRGNGSFANMKFRSLVYVPRRMTNAELQLKTAA